MKRAIFLCMLVCCLLVAVVSAEPLDAVTMANELGQVQSFENMKTGVYAIPEKTINSYFSTIIADNPKVKDSNIAIHDNNKITITTTVEKTGTIQLNCTIKQFHFDKDNALLELHVDKKELMGHSIASWFMNQMSLGFITDIYGNPLTQANINSEVKGNTIIIDLEPFAAGLFKTGIGQSMGSSFEISNVTTGDRVLYLHTNVSISLLAK